MVSSAEEFLVKIKMKKTGHKTRRISFYATLRENPLNPCVIEVLY